MGHHDVDVKVMDAAVAEGRKSRPSPNPRVGAVVARGEEILASAFHAKAGDDHAEVVVLREAGAAAKGATLYCTLEPCNHHGKTPPCVDVILKAGIARVVVGARDPNPNVVGKGIERLRAEGVEVVVMHEHRGANELLAPWAKYITQGLPYVGIKLGLSLDGRIATRTGASRWVTGEEARAKVHELRNEHDAVAVGIGTALADDPRLTVRHVPGTSPTRVVFDTQLRLSPTSKLSTTAREVPTWVLTAEDAPAANEDVLASLGVRVIRVARTAEGRVEVEQGLRALADAGVVSVLVEGGAELVGSMLATHLADELHAFLAPILLGPRGRPGAVDWAGPDSPADAPRILLPRWELCGDDAYVRGPIAYRDLDARRWPWNFRAGELHCREARMAIRTILHYPDPRLREKALPIEAITPEIQKLADDMAETMYAAPGCGLAATQIGVNQRLFVIDTATEDEPSRLTVFINPEIVKRDGETTWEEGCLSFPKVHEEIRRAERVTVRALGRDGKPFELEAEGLLAIAVQHENDHLDGVLMIDHMGTLKKRMVQRKMQKRAAQHQDDTSAE